MSYKLIPKNYQEDSAETRKEVAHQISYEKMYHEEYVKGLIKMIEDLSDGLQVAIADSKNRGTQRCAISYLRKTYDTIRKFKEDEVSTRR